MPKYGGAVYDPVNQSLVALTTAPPFRFNN